MSLRVSHGIIFAGLIVGAILVSGSSIRSIDRSARQRRHASCTSCRQDRPDALSSPWYGSPVYEPTSFTGVHGGPLEPQKQWHRKQQPRDNLSAIQPRVPHLPTGNFGIDPTGIRRENPLGLENSRGLRPHAAPAPSSFAPDDGPLRQSAYIIDEYPAINQTPRQRYTPYVGERSSDLSNARYDQLGSNLRSYEYLEDGDTSNESFEVPSDQRFFVVYRADRNSDVSEEDTYVPTRSFAPETRGTAEKRVATAGDRTPRYYPGLTRAHESDEPKGSVGAFVQTPEFRYNPYNLDSSVLRMMEGTAAVYDGESMRGKSNVNSGGSKDGESNAFDEADSDYDALMAIGDLKVDAKKDEGADKGKKAEKLISARATGKGQSDVDPDLVRDIEGPPVETTESMLTDSLETTTPSTRELGA